MVDHAIELRRHAAKVYHWDSGDLRAVMVRAAVEIDRLREALEEIADQVSNDRSVGIAQKALDARDGDEP